MAEMPGALDTASPIVGAVCEGALNGTLSDMLPGSSPDDNRREMLKLVNDLSCLKGRGFVARILGVLDSATTNREFLHAVEEVGELLKSVRGVLSKRGVIEYNQNPLGVITQRADVPNVDSDAVSLREAATVPLILSFVSRVLHIVDDTYNTMQTHLARLVRPVHPMDAGKVLDGFEGETQPDPVSSTSTTKHIKPRDTSWNGVEFGTKRAKLIYILKKLEAEGRQGLTYQEVLALYNAHLATLNLQPVAKPAVALALSEIKKDFITAGAGVPFEILDSKRPVTLRFLAVPQATTVAVQPVVKEIPASDGAREAYLDQDFDLNIFSPNAGSRKPLEIANIDEVPGLDENERKILIHLLTNPARILANELGEKVGVEATAVIMHIDRINAMLVRAGYTGIIDTNGTGHILFVETSSHPA